MNDADMIPCLLVVAALWTLLWCALGVCLIRSRRRKATADDRFTGEILDARIADRERKKAEPPARVARAPLPGLPKPAMGTLTLKPCEMVHCHAHIASNEVRYISGISVVFLGDDLNDYKRALQGAITLYLRYRDLMLGPWPLSIVMAIEKTPSEPVFAFDQPLVLPRASMIDLDITNGPTAGEAKLMWVLHGTFVDERVTEQEASAYVPLYQTGWPGPQPRASWPGFVPGKEKF